MKDSEAGILLITHGRQGQCLLETAAHLLGEAPARVTALGWVGTERRTEMENDCASAAVELRGEGGATLILTDLFGCTQAGIAEKICAENEGIACAHGLNLAMLLEAISQRRLPLKKLQAAVVAAAKSGIKRG